MCVPTKYIDCNYTVLESKLINLIYFNEPEVFVSRNL